MSLKRLWRDLSLSIVVGDRRLEELEASRTPVRQAA